MAKPDKDKRSDPNPPNPDHSPLGPGKPLDGSPAVNTYTPPDVQAAEFVVGEQDWQTRLSGVAPGATIEEIEATKDKRVERPANAPPADVFEPRAVAKPKPTAKPASEREFPDPDR